MIRHVHGKTEVDGRGVTDRLSRTGQVVPGSLGRRVRRDVVPKLTDPRDAREMRTGTRNQTVGLERKSIGVVKEMNKDWFERRVKSRVKLKTLMKTFD